MINPNSAVPRNVSPLNGNALRISKMQLTIITTASWMKALFSLPLYILRSSIETMIASRMQMEQISKYITRPIISIYD